MLSLVVGGRRGYVAWPIQCTMTCLAQNLLRCPISGWLSSICAQIRLLKPHHVLRVLFTLNDKGWLFLLSFPALSLPALLWLTSQFSPQVKLIVYLIIGLETRILFYSFEGVWFKCSFCPAPKTGSKCAKLLMFSWLSSTEMALSFGLIW